VEGPLKSGRALWYRALEGDMQKRPDHSSQLLTTGFLAPGKALFQSPLVFHAWLSLTLLGGMNGCAPAPVQKVAPLSMSSVKAADEPCWVRAPDCMAGAESTALYFAGQSREPLPSWGRPRRESFHSAQRDAEQEYARYLGVDVESSIYLQSVFKNEHYQSQFKETVKQSVHRTVSDLLKADEYFVSHQQARDGEPLWTVHVLIKIEKETVNEHRIAVVEETQRRAEEAQRRAEAPPAPDEWTASVFNIDDSAAIHVNGTKINECGFSQSCTVKLSPHFKPGTNKVRIENINHAVFWTYGYEVRKNEKVMYEGRCGQVWWYGCGFDTETGVVHTFDFEVEIP